MAKVELMTSRLAFVFFVQMAAPSLAVENEKVEPVTAIVDAKRCGKVPNFSMHINFKGKGGDRGQEKQKKTTKKKTKKKLTTNTSC